VRLEQQIACVLREIAMRERVYPNWVRSGRMKQDKADHEIAAMRAVLETLKQCGPDNVRGVACVARTAGLLL
jgi:hypothetical protein